MTFFRPSRCVVSNVGVVKAEFDLPDQTCSVDRNLILQQASLDRQTDMLQWQTCSCQQNFDSSTGKLRQTDRQTDMLQWQRRHKVINLIIRQTSSERQTCYNDRHAPSTENWYFSRLAQKSDLQTCHKVINFILQQTDRQYVSLPKDVFLRKESE